MAQWGKSTLIDAAADGNIEMCKKRMETQAAKINAKDGQGRFPLLESARWGHVDCCKFLVSQGADPKQLGPLGTTILHVAAMNGHDALINYLVKDLKIDVNSIDKAKDTPLHNASGGGKVSTVKLLLSLGANRDARNERNKTPNDLASNAATTEIFTDKGYSSITN